MGIREAKCHNERPCEITRDSIDQERPFGMMREPTGSRGTLWYQKRSFGKRRGLVESREVICDQVKQCRMLS